jgi:hypothetical protein
MIRAAFHSDPNFQVKDCWKSYSIVDETTFIKAAMDELKPKMVNACWKNLWSEAVNDFKDSQRSMEKTRRSSKQQEKLVVKDASIL